MKLYRWFSLTLVALLLAVPVMAVGAAPLSAGGTASMTLTSSLPNPISVGGEVAFDLAFSVNNIVPGVAGAEIYLSYNPAAVAPPSTPGVAVAEVLPDFFGVSNVSINEVLPAAQCPGGTSPCVHLVLAGPPQTSQVGVAARFHFRALAEGSACFSMLQANLVDANGFKVDFIGAPDLCRPIQGRTTTGMVTRQGVPAIPNPGGGSLGCVSVAATGTWTYGPVYTDRTGKFSFPNLPTGTYAFRASYPGYLDSVINGVVLPANALTIDTGTTNLRGGDVNGDAAINILDIGVIISKFGRTNVAVKSATVSCAGDESADINDDGQINISDLAIAAGNWGRTGPTAWQP